MLLGCIAAIARSGLLLQAE